MRILILGDSHGHLDLVARACQQAKDIYGIEAAIQVGDFGFFPKIIDKYLKSDCLRFPVPLHVIDGNHEDHGWLIKSKATGEVVKWSKANLIFHERGSVDHIGGVPIGFIGGALHADRRQEWAGQWWTLADGQLPPGRRQVPKDPVWANWVTQGDMQRAIAAFMATPPELVIAHSCPAGIGVGMTGAQALIEDVDRFITRVGHYAGPHYDCGEGGLTSLWRELPVRPHHWFFGHFHQLSETAIDQTTFVCVGSTDDSDGVLGVRPVLYDTTKRIHIIDRMVRLGSVALP
jgi:predicted phosphodiesterase